MLNRYEYIHNNIGNINAIDFKHNERRSTMKEYPTFQNFIKISLFGTVDANLLDDYNLLDQRTKDQCKEWYWVTSELLTSGLKARNETLIIDDAKTYWGRKSVINIYEDEVLKSVFAEQT